MVSSVASVFVSKLTTIFIFEEYLVTICTEIKYVIFMLFVLN